MYMPTLNAKISQTRIRIRKDRGQDPDPKRPWAGSGSEMTLQVGSGSEINSFGSATLIDTSAVPNT